MAPKKKHRDQSDKSFWINKATKIESNLNFRLFGISDQEQNKINK
jgi:hypothetical protein